MTEMKHRKGWYRGCYMDLDHKVWSCGQQMNLKKLLDLWWNSVHIAYKNKIHVCYKNAWQDGGPAYELDGLPENVLRRDVQVSDCWDEDADGYPIVHATLIRKHNVLTNAEKKDGYTCCICGEVFNDFGNNPYPVVKDPDAKCCSNCNIKVVIPERLKSYDPKNEQHKVRKIDWSIK